MWQWIGERIPVNEALELPFLVRGSGGRGGRALLAEGTAETKAWVGKV